MSFLLPSGYFPISLLLIIQARQILFLGTDPHVLAHTEQ